MSGCLFVRFQSFQFLPPSHFHYKCHGKPSFFSPLRAAVFKALDSVGNPAQEYERATLIIFSPHTHRRSETAGGNQQATTTISFRYLVVKKGKKRNAESNFLFIGAAAMTTDRVIHCKQESSWEIFPNQSANGESSRVLRSTLVLAPKSTQMLSAQVI